MKILQDKPHMAAEVTYKLRADVNNGVLVKLTDFLQLPEVIEAGITLKEDQKFITPTLLHMVDNVHSKSSTVRMVTAPPFSHRITKQSTIVDLKLEHHGPPRLQKRIPRFRLSVSITLADL